MAADEQEPQHVVAIVRAVQPLGERRFGIVQIREELFGGQRLLAAAAAHLVERGVAPDQDEPGGGVARRAIDRPVPQRPQAGLLERLLGTIQIAEIAQEGAERLWAGGGQRRLDPGKITHCAPVPEKNTEIGRISSALMRPAAIRGASSWRAASIASSRVAQSMT